ncbi:trypsin-like peptidase domain-containing protein [Kitasatospora sp. NPDC097691]|uniref:trypsin-like serine peptidase n=1 Tax=Kitasatospora sp. NPDC097691 TaxID=3157231 RepID=UPI00332E8FB1
MTNPPLSWLPIPAPLDTGSAPTPAAHREPVAARGQVPSPSSRTRAVRLVAAVASAVLLGAGLAPTASAAAPSAGNPDAAQLGTYWTPARMAAARPVGTGSTGSTGPAAATADGPRPGEFIPASRSFDGMPQAGTFFWTDAAGTHRTCSGSVVRSPGRDLVLSAGHCLTGASGTSPKRHLGFVPQYHDGLTPFGVFPVRTNGVYVPQEYYDRGPHAGAAYDFAFAVTEPGQDGRRIQDAVGALDLLTGSGHSHAPVRMIGYPAGAQKPLECLSRTTRWVSDDPADPGTFERIACDGFVGGTSGGPMLVPRSGGWAVTGIIGGYHTGGKTPKISYSAHFGPATRALYQAATTGAPPAGPAS